MLGGMSNESSRTALSAETHFDAEKNIEQPKIQGILDLQIRFAEAVARKTGRPLAEVLLEDTSLFRRFGFGKRLRPDHPKWQAYVKGIGSVPLLDWTYAFYAAREKKKGEDLEPMFGCFSYSYKEPTVSIHFDNADKSGSSPLSEERMEARHQELKKMFAYIKAHAPEAQFVRGESWLYNLERYRRLFPPAYGASLESAPVSFRSNSVWGQFLDRSGRVREEMAQGFLKRVLEAQPTEIAGCLPYPVLTTQVDIKEFYRFFGIN